MWGDILDTIKINKYEFIKHIKNNATFIFSTANGKLDFNKSTAEGIKNLKELKKWFNLKEIGFLDQIHSDSIYIYDGEIHQGDGIITNKKDIGIGIFTADCVPVLMYDEKKQIIAAVHSGWKGTLSKITSSAIDRMIDKYGSNPEDITALIGPHNRVCCYEVGKEVAAEFLQDPLYGSDNVIVNGKLNLEKCIKRQLMNKGIKEANIQVVEICTYCNTEYEMHSYRKSRVLSGRMFSFIYLTN